MKKRGKLWRKQVCILMSLCLAASAMAPITAMAEDPVLPGDGDNTVVGGNTTEDTPETDAPAEEGTVVVPEAPGSNAVADEATPAAVYEDAATADTWQVEESPGTAADGTKGTGTSQVTEDGWLHFTATGGDNANHPSLVNQDATFKDGTFSATIKSTGDTANNRGGIYLHANGPLKGIFIGYDTGGWFYQIYNGGSNPYASLSIAAPADGSQTKLEVTLNEKNLTFSVKINGVEVLKDQDYSSIPEANRTGKIAVKAAKWGAVTTNIYLKDIHYPGQQEIASYSITGTVKDQDGAALENVYVSASNGASALTDSNGSYKLSSLVNGEYTLNFTKDGYESATQTVTVTDGDAAATEVKLTKINVETETLSTNEMDVLVDKNFPRVIQYDMKGENAGKKMEGQSKVLDTIQLNDTINLKPESITSKVEGSKITYTIPLKDAESGIDATMTATLTATDNQLAFDITEITYNTEDSAPVQRIFIPEHNLVSVNSTQQDANLRATTMSGTTFTRGDVDLDVKPGGIIFDPEYPELDSYKYMYAFVSNSELSAGLESSSDFGTAGAGSNNYRVTATATEKGDAYTSVGLSSSPWYFDRIIYGNVEGKHREFQMTHLKDDMPHAAVAITGNINDDDVVDWQDGAIAFRDIMHEIYKSEEVPELVAYRIAMNFGGQAQNPFLTTLDNVKRVAMHTDGLGQSILLKGYASEGHDSGHPDYDDIGERIGGVEEMQKLLNDGAKYGARFGVHVNASEMYPEADAFNNLTAQRVDLRDKDGNFIAHTDDIIYGWNWIDQAVRLNALYDLGIESENYALSRRARFDALGDLVKGLDFIYVDVWGNAYSNFEDAYATRRLSDEIKSNGWRVTQEWGFANEYDSTFSHWATDLNYGGEDNQGVNSILMRFLRNHQKDTWQADYYPSYTGGGQNSPLLGGYNMVDFEGWQGANDYDQYMEVLYTFNLATKYLQHYQVTEWELADQPTTLSGRQWTADSRVVLKDENGRGDNKIVITRGSTDATDMNQYRSRTITLNDKVILKGTLPNGNLSGGGNETYLLPWIWNADGEEQTLDGQKLYHWNNLAGTTEWELPDDWKDVTSVNVFELTDLGKTNMKTVSVTDHKIKLTAEAKTPYVVYPGNVTEGGFDAEDIEWSVDMHAVDVGFNSGLDNVKTYWDIDETKGGKADITKNVTSNPMLDLSGEVSMSTTVTDLEPGKQYAIYVGVDNRSDSKASMTVTEGDQVLAANYTNRSIAQNYVKAYTHNTNSATIAGEGSYFQNMYVFFTPSSDTVTLTLAKEGTEEGNAYFDDIRILRNDAKNVIETDENGSITKFAQDFENNAQGIYPFVVGAIEGIEDNRTHLSERHELYTQKWDTKKLPDVIDGNWSLKTNGLTQRNNLVYQTIPQNFRFEPGVTYTVDFDYYCGSEGIYELAIGNGEYINANSIDRTPLSNSLADRENAKKNHITFTIVGDASGQSWFGIYSPSTAPDVQGAIESEIDFGGYKDFIMDNLTIQKSDVQKGELSEALNEAATKTEVDYPANLWTVFATAYENAQTVYNDLNATQAQVDEAIKALNDTMDALDAAYRSTSISGIVKDQDGKAIADALLTITADHFETLKIFTDENGAYDLTDVPVRSYNIKVSKEGYEYIYSEVKTENNKEIARDFTMKAKKVDYTNNFNDADISMMEGLTGNTKDPTVNAATQDKSGALEVAFPGGGQSNIVDSAAPQFKDGVIEADITPTGSGLRFGFLLRANGMNDRIYVGVGDAENNYFFEYWNGSNNYYTGMYTGPAMTAGVTRHMKAEIIGQSVKLWVDGQFIFEVTNASLPTEAGFVGFNNRNSSKYIIDNLEVISYDDSGLPEKETTTTVSGIVESTSGSDIFTGMTARLVNENGEVIAQVEVDENGKYTFPAVPEGKYTVRFEKDGDVFGETGNLTVDPENPPEGGVVVPPANVEEPEQPDPGPDPDPDPQPPFSGGGTVAPSADGWKFNGTGWWYDNGNGSYTASDWQLIEGEWYYFDANGYMATGWIFDGANWFYLNPNADGSCGKMMTGWVFDGTNWFYLNPVSDGTRGAMVTGWLFDNDYQAWFYLNPNADGTCGRMMTGWNWVDGKCYYLNPNGSLVVNGTTPDGYQVDASGAWIH